MADVILVLNAGSSSLKFQVFDLASGLTIRVELEECVALHLEEVADLAQHRRDLMVGWHARNPIERLRD